MLQYLIVGFILPCILVFYLYLKIPKFIIIFYPIGITAALLINDWGFNYFWKLKHTFNELSLSALPFNLGLFPTLGCLFIGSIHYHKLNMLAAFLIFTGFTTLIEFFGVLAGEVIYRNGWNILWTALSYFTAYIIAYIYYKLVIRYKILQSN
ncbi:hypothetical protein ELQ35_14120 [Peribacillus cavernae]|uniref:Uncharacterized protein n=1 Tax=Peribacillus cavernae TaxID=1674310 RepID=A0A3S0VX58_9BACI|nr:hypothetical protein [Peribacillus cavernae]MDQ0220457.1 hypothetical protein [Peribacillus cavernae]RUQ28040.1 hypothetical protein ELQ35_14120 [Peribacillus cavernae]